MKISRRHLLPMLAAPALSSLPLVGARAQAFPSRPIRLLVGFAAGGSTDTMARLIGQALSERLGQSVVVENKAGAGTNIATEAALKSPADGYTLLMVGPSVAINATLYKELNFNFLQDGLPVASVASQSQVMLINPALPVRDIPQFIEYARQNPGKMTVASAGVGSIGHLSGELFKMKTGLDLLHVPYRGAAPALADLVSGQTHVSFAGIAGSVEFVKSGMLRALGVSTRTRSEKLPDTPCISEFVPDYESNDWFGIAAPKNVPAPILEFLHKAISESIKDEKMAARFADLGGSPLVLSSEQFGKLVRDDTQKWGEVIKVAKLTPI